MNGAQLTYWRLIRNLRQEDLARELGVSIRTISRWEVAQEKPLAQPVVIALRSLEDRFPVKLFPD